MAWSYSGEPDEDNPKDQVRFLIQDTDHADQLLSDGEIQYLLTLEGGPLKAAVKAAETIGGKFARKCDEKVGPVSVSFSQKSKQYFELAAKLKRHSDIKQAMPFAGGLDISQKETERENSDRVPPIFTREKHDIRALTQEEEDR